MYLPSVQMFQKRKTFASPSINCASTHPCRRAWTKYLRRYLRQKGSQSFSTNTHRVFLKVQLGAARHLCQGTPFHDKDNFASTFIVDGYKFYPTITGHAGVDSFYQRQTLNTAVLKWPLLNFTHERLLFHVCGKWSPAYATFH